MNISTINSKYRNCHEKVIKEKVKSQKVKIICSGKVKNERKVGKEKDSGWSKEKDK